MAHLHCIPVQTQGGRTSYSDNIRGLITKITYIPTTHMEIRPISVEGLPGLSLHSTTTPSIEASASTVLIDLIVVCEDLLISWNVKGPHDSRSTELWNVVMAQFTVGPTVHRVAPLFRLLWLHISDTISPLQIVSTPSAWGGIDSKEQSPTSKCKVN